MKIQRYKFFDQIFELRSDHATTLSLMDTMFRRFAVTNDEKSDEISRYEVLTKLGEQAGIVTQDYCYIVKHLPRLSSMAQGIILRETLARIRSHLLFHAAALSWRDKGLIVAADSGCGKTTLTLALVRQGFKFLSDEAAALDIHNGELTPYPRSLLVREGTIRAFQQQGWELPSHQTGLKSDDMTALHLSPALLGDSCQPYCLVIIPWPEGDERICEVTLDTLPDRLLADLQAIGFQNHLAPALRGVQKLGRFPKFKAKAALINQIYETCEQHGVLVLNVEGAAVDPSYYKKKPQLQKLSKLTAALTLSRHFLGGYRSALVQENFQGSAAGLIEPLVKILEPVKCYQLTPGQLDHTVEMINGLC